MNVEYIIERLEVAVEQIRHVRRLSTSETSRYRLDIALQALQNSMPLIRASGNAGSSGNVKAPEANAGDGAGSVTVVWERPRKRQRFEGELLPSGRIHLDGRGTFTPTGACKAFVPVEINGWSAWKYWEEDEKRWLPIDELRKAGWYD